MGGQSHWVWLAVVRPTFQVGPPLVPTFCGTPFNTVTGEEVWKIFRDTGCGLVFVGLSFLMVTEAPLPGTGIHPGGGGEPLWFR